MIRALVFFLLALSQIATAQILPPEFQCVKNDTLIWVPPNNPCGPFNAYEIFASQNATGPFSLLASITDPMQTSFFHSNPSGETWYYYLQGDYNCPGEPRLSSDTLNNLPPEISPIRSVSVVGNDVQVSWHESPSPETSGYVIYRTTPFGIVPIDTVFGATSYLDQTASPANQSELYQVVALDPCGNTSLFDTAHGTLHQTTSVSICEQTVRLSWNQYQGWSGGINRQEVWVGLNGGNSEWVATIGASDTSYVFTDTNDGDSYCFTVKAFNAANDEAASNEVCLPSLDIVQPPRPFFVKNVSVNPDNTVEVIWHWNPNSELQEAFVLRSDNNLEYSAIDPFPATPPLSADNAYLDVAASPANGSLFYSVQAKDDCDTLHTSAYGSSIFLQLSTPNPPNNQLDWTEYDVEAADLLDYSVFKVVGSIENQIVTLDPDNTRFEDLVDPENIEEAKACYYVVARSEIRLPDGNVEQTESRSNLVCNEQTPVVFVPNAFAPRGRNQEFKPLITFIESISEYQLLIYNRWGELVFESRDPYAGWDGKIDGQDTEQNSFLYQIIITQSNGNRIDKKGVVVLVK